MGRASCFTRIIKGSGNSVFSCRPRSRTSRRCPGYWEQRKVHKSNFFLKERTSKLFGTVFVLAVENLIEKICWPSDLDKPGDVGTSLAKGSKQPFTPIPGESKTGGLPSGSCLKGRPKGCLLHSGLYTGVFF